MSVMSFRMPLLFLIV